ncbi:WecB/TagA/CpsF family glycosyltransferase [Citreimonas salinaria]|uniref:Polymer biosynthesis protein, WecB/TagA/CpsF family n=1 Tax=Citreimonas salinaria TaxID=321339 RepID=A0A1H3KCB7_9RHOB|nr:WecB/TagA/CpsF family glycosyltransferase [Citreimonas salinaria]SDY49763.1 polymer biosynthesis protein, WecB/TagA/CpsF family [Citreimonas salinaria]
MDFTVEGQTVRVTVPNWAALEARVTERLAQRKGFALATLNLDHLVKLRQSPAFRSAYAAHELVTADGNPIVWASRLAGRPVALVPGSDAVLPLARVAARQGVPVALVGATAETLAAATAALERDVRDLEVVLCTAPPMGFDPEGPGGAEILEQVVASGARLCFIALGAPRQEILAARGRALAPHVGFASVGAGLDFLAGTQRRAPLWARRLSVEWMWRALSDPRRLAGRYARCVAILPGQLAQAVVQRFRTRGA